MKRILLRIDTRRRRHLGHAVTHEYTWAGVPRGRGATHFFATEAEAKSHLRRVKREGKHKGYKGFRAEHHGLVLAPPGWRPRPPTKRRRVSHRKKR